MQSRFPGQTIAVQVPTNLLVMDTTLLRDADDEPGAYVAAYGLAPFWRGSSIFTSSNGGVNYEAELTLPAPGSSVGVTTDELGDWTGGNVFDEVNSVTVRMQNGSSSATTRAGVLAGDNPVAIKSGSGWEILQYRDVTANKIGRASCRERV